MTAITKLPDEWRGNNYKDWPREPELCCADQLEAALPTWTKITDSPDTWPDDGTYLWAYGSNTCDYLHATYDVCMMRVVADMVKHVYWRSLCDLDYPPEDEG